MNQTISPNKLLQHEANEAIERFFEDESVPAKETLEGLRKMSRRLATLINTVECFNSNEVLPISEWDSSPSGALTKRKI